jgi:hypothetical protein
MSKKYIVEVSYKEDGKQGHHTFHVEAKDKADAEKEIRHYAKLAGMTELKFKHVTLQ